MNKVKIFTDSTSDLNKDMYLEKDITVIPLYVNFGDESYRDDVDITVEEVFKKYEETKIYPKTSAIPPQIYIENFQKAIDEGYDVFYIGIGSKFSSNYQNAITASQELPSDRVAIAESMNLSSGLGLLVLKAAKFRDQGMSAFEIKEEVEKLVPRVCTQFSIDTLEFLHKGGRCSGTVRIIGTLLKLKPIVRVIDGSMVVTKKPLGKYQRSLNEMLEYVKYDLENDNIDPDYVLITHPNTHQDAIYLREKLEEMHIVCDNLVETNAKSTVATHCGPRTIGVLYILKKLR